VWLPLTRIRVQWEIFPHIVRFQPGSLGAMHAFFPLTGRHAEIECAACHSGGRYAGTPTACAACHAGDAPALHYPGVCTLCHTTTAWKPATFDHKAFDTSDCAACHARNKPAGHWNGQCSACHTTSAWKPANFDHAVAGATDCLACHGRENLPPLVGAVLGPPTNLAASQLQPRCRSHRLPVLPCRR
jgi:hypothetical protein